MKIWKFSKCENCEREINVGVLLEGDRRSFVICGDCIQAAAELLTEPHPAPAAEKATSNAE